MGLIVSILAGLCVAGAATAGVIVTVENQSSQVANIQPGQLPQTTVLQYGQQ